MSLIIKDCKILKNNKLISTNIFIKKNKIFNIGRCMKADHDVDAKGKLVIPGLIDCHVHFREPGMERKEDFFTGSCAAASGGISTILDMPNTNPPTTTIKLLNEKRKLAKKSIVNYGFHFGSTNGNLKEIKKAKNIASVKVFMDISTGKLIINNDDVLKNIFKNSKIISVHAEGKMVEKAVNLIKNTKNRLYLCHITSKEEIRFLKKKKIKNKVFVEVTPHHLFLTKIEEIKKKGFVMMKPSLKAKEDQNALWKAIKEGTVDTIATDHAPHTKKEKESLIKEKIPSGVPGCETMLPLLLDAYNEKKLSLKTIVELCCENPAKIFNIRNKGKIKKGYDADLVIIDLGLKKKVNNKNLYTRCGWSPFNGWKLKGWPITTIVNGKIIFDNGKINKIKAKEVEYGKI